MPRDQHLVDAVRDILPAKAVPEQGPEGGGSHRREGQDHSRDREVESGFGGTIPEEQRKSDHGRDQAHHGIYPDATFAEEPVAEVEHAHRVEEEHEEDERRDQEIPPRGREHASVLDHAGEAAEDDPGQGREEESPVEGEPGPLHPAVDQEDRDDQDEGVGEGIDERVRSPALDGIVCNICR